MHPRDEQEMGWSGFGHALAQPLRCDFRPQWIDNHPRASNELHIFCSCTAIPSHPTLSTPAKQRTCAAVGTGATPRPWFCFKHRRSYARVAVSVKSMPRPQTHLKNNIAPVQLRRRDGKGVRKRRVGYLGNSASSFPGEPLGCLASRWWCR